MSENKVKPKKEKTEKVKKTKESLVEKLNHEESLFGELLQENIQQINKVKKKKKS